MRWDRHSVAPLSITTLSACALGHCQGLGGAGLSAFAWPANNLSVMVPFRLTWPATIKQVFWLNGTASGNVDCGIYDLDGNLLASAGSTAMSGANAFQGVTLGSPTLLGAGRFYMALACSTTGASFYSLPTIIAAASGWKMLGCAEVTANMALATGVTFATYTRTRVPFFGVATEAL